MKSTKKSVEKSAPRKRKKKTNKPFAKRFRERTWPAAKVLAENVRRARAGLDLTQGELAGRIAKADQATIGLIEKARSNPTLRMIEAIAVALDTTPSDLLRPRKIRSRKTKPRTGP
jgi:DNA-binding XRE family transcriptional regulator